MCKTHETVKHEEDRVITNSNLLSENNDAHSEPVREIPYMLVLSRSYIHKTITANFQE